MIHPDIFGTIAATLTTICFIPQAVKLIMSKNTEGVSLAMYVIFSIGIIFWFIYGIMLASWPMIIANVITLSLALTIIITIIKNRSE